MAEELYLIKGETMRAIADAIRSKTGSTELIAGAAMAEQIENLSGTGGGSSADVRYVTFMSHDGSVELGKKAVAVGDDCADPVERGVFGTPTKESTAQYNYTFVGWATTANGAWDENALKAVTEDRTVYAAYASAVRYYTITYLDSDGVTVLKTESLAYGSTPSYTPSKDNVSFAGWQPELAAVTKEASYLAQWTEILSFADAPWETIAAAIASGKATTYYAVGDEKEITLEYSNGSTEQVLITIADFGKCELPDGSKDNITIVTKHSLATTKSLCTSGGAAYIRSDLYTHLNGTIFSALPAELSALIKPRVLYTYNGSVSTGTCWALSLNELNLEASLWDCQGSGVVGSAFSLFKSNADRIRTKGKDGEAFQYWTRSYRVSGSSVYNARVNDTGSGVVSTTTGGSYGVGVTFGFCI